MRLKKSIKKIMALATGASMLGATMLGATAAADLADYPAPFIKDGVFSGFFVVGDAAGAVDTIGVSDIATSLQYSATTKAGTTTGSVTLSGDNVKIDRAGDALEIGEEIGNVTESLTSDDTTSLKSYQVKTDKGTSDVNQYLRFRWGSAATTAGLENGWANAKVTFTSSDDDVVGDYLYFKDGDYAFQYELEFEEGFESDLTGTAYDANDLEDEVLTILGQDFEVTKATCTGASKIRLEMMGGAISDTLVEGETRTYTIGEKEYEVTNTIITDTGTVYAKFVVNGESTKKLEEGGTDTLRDGTILGVNDVLPNEAGDVSGDLVEIFLGANRIVFEDTTTGATTTDGTVEINNENIEDAEVNIDFTNSANSTVKVNSITYTLTTDGAGGDEPYIAPGKGLREFLDEPQGMLSSNWDINYQGLSNPGTSKIKIKPSGDDEYRLSFVNTQGVAYDNVRFLYATGSSLIWGDDTDALVFEQVKPNNEGANWSNYTIHKDDYFVVCHGCRTDTGVSRVLQFDNIDTSNREIQLTDVGSSAQITAIYTSGAGTNNSWGNGTFNVGGYTFDFSVVNDAGLSGDVSKRLWVDLDDDGTLGGTSGLIVNGGGWINFVYVGNVDANNNSINYRAAVNNASLQLVTDNNNFDEAPAADELVNMTFSSASSVIDLGITTNAVIGLNPKTTDYNDDLTIGMTYYGVKTAETTQTNDPDVLEIDYPLSQLLGQVFVTFGAAQATTGTTGESVIVNRIGTGATKFASEISNLTNVNTIIVGGPCANQAAMTVMGNPEPCTEGFEEGTGLIKLYDHGNGKVALLVAGFSGQDTRNAAAVLSDYGDYDLSGTEVKVTKVNNALTVAKST